MVELKSCPFCGGAAKIQCINEAILDARGGFSEGVRYVVFCSSCRIQRPSYDTAEQAIAAWNTRAEPEAKALTLEELREMDGKPVYCQSGDGEHGWAIVEIEGDTLFLHGPGIEWNYEPDIDFINMTYDDPDGHFGLHLLGWRCYDREPKGE